MIYIVLISIFIVIITLIICKKLMYRLNIINNIEKIEKLKFDIVEEVIYYVMVEKMIKYEIEIFNKYLKKYGSKRFKGIFLNEEEYKNAELHTPNFIINFNILILPVLILKRKDGTIITVNPHKDDIQSNIERLI